MMAIKPIRALELYFPMIQFLKIIIINKLPGCLGLQEAYKCVVQTQIQSEMVHQTCIQSKTVSVNKTLTRGCRFLFILGSQRYSLTTDKTHLPMADMQAWQYSEEAFQGRGYAVALLVISETACCQVGQENCGCCILARDKNVTVGSA